jgi:CheY-like chemotaxis protein
MPTPIEIAKPSLTGRSRLLDQEKPDRRRILVVDDNIDAAKSLTRVLTLIFGQEVDVAHDGPSALRAAESFRPEIVFLDIGLPGMTGLDVAARIRERPWSELHLLVAVTGWGQQKDREKSRAAGFDLHLVKPVKPEIIRDLLFGKLTSLW